MNQGHHPQSKTQRTPDEECRSRCVRPCKECGNEANGGRRNARFASGQQLCAEARSLVATHTKPRGNTINNISGKKKWRQTRSWWSETASQGAQFGAREVKHENLARTWLFAPDLDSKICRARQVSCSAYYSDHNCA